MDSHSSDVRAVYLTFPDLESAKVVATQLVEARLAACVNLLPGATSIYRWEGETVVESECVAIAKTAADTVDALIAAVQELHPYDVPCAVAYAAVGGAETYLEWVLGQVA